MVETINGSYMDESDVPACCKISAGGRKYVECGNKEGCNVKVCWFRDIHPKKRVINNETYYF